MTLTLRVSLFYYDDEGFYYWQGPPKDTSTAQTHTFIVSKRIQIGHEGFQFPANKKLLDKILSVYYQTLKKKKKTGSTK